MPMTHSDKLSHIPASTAPVMSTVNPSAAIISYGATTAVCLTQTLRQNSQYETVFCVYKYTLFWGFFWTIFCRQKSYRIVMLHEVSMITAYIVEMVIRHRRWVSKIFKNMFSLFFIPNAKNLIRYPLAMKGVYAPKYLELG